MVNSTHIKATFNHTLIYSFSSMLEKAVGFIMLPIYAHMLGTEDYGIIQMIEMISTVLGILAGSAMLTAVNRFYFEMKTDEKQSVFMSTSVITMFLLAATITLPSLLFTKPIARLAFGKDGLEYFIFLGILTFFAETTALSGQMYILQKQKPILFSVLSFFRLLLGFSLNIYLVIYRNLGVTGVLYSGLITGSVYSVYVHLYTLKSTGIRFSKDDALMILKYSLPLLPGYFAQFVRGNADRIILSSLLGLAEFGVFSMVMKFAVLTGIIVHEPFMKIWSVKRMEIADIPEGPKTISRTFTLYFALSLLFGLVLSIETPLILKLLTPEAFWVSAMVAFLAVTSRIANSSYYHFVFGLLYGKQTTRISIIQGISAAISVGVSIFFIQKYGLLGACVAAVVVNTLQCFIAHFMSQKCYFIEYEWLKIILMVFCTIALIVIINRFSVLDLHWDKWLNENILPFLREIFLWFKLDSIKHGKLLVILNDKFPVLIEASIKAVLSLSFIPCLIAIKVIRWGTCVEVISKFLRMVGILKRKYDVIEKTA